MTLAVDVNPLVYASQRDSPFYDAARRALADVWQGGELLYLFWPVAVGYVRLSTSPRVHREPLSPDEAIDNIRSLIALPNVRTGIESSEFPALFASACAEVRARGDLVSDAYLVALMRQHEVRRILTHDRDFRKFDGIQVIDPFA